MAIQHLKWEPKGRKFTTDTPNRFVYQSFMGQKNIDTGSGNYVPYIWDATNKILKFSDHEVRLTSTGLEFWNSTSKLNKLSFHPEKKPVDAWERDTPIISSLAVEEIDDLSSKVLLKVSYNLETEDQKIAVSLNAGSSDKVHFTIENTAKKAGKQSVMIQFDELGEDIQRQGPSGSLPSCGIAFSNSWWKWLDSEMVGRNREHKTDKSVIRILEKDYAKDEKVITSPDTWGPTVIAANADDGDDGNGTWNINGLFDNTMWIGQSSAVVHAAGWSWTMPEITNGSTINSMFLRAYGKYGIVDVNGAFRMRDADPATVAAWNSTTYPRNCSNWINERAETTITLVDGTWNFGDGDADEFDWAADLQDLLDTYGGFASGDRIDICVWCDGQPGVGGSVEDSSHAGTNPSTLYIDYTLAGAGGTPAPTNRFINMMSMIIPGVLIAGAIKNPDLTRRELGQPWKWFEKKENV